MISIFLLLSFIWCRLTQMDYEKLSRTNKWEELTDNTIIPPGVILILFSFHDYHHHGSNPVKAEKRIYERFFSKISDFHDLLEHVMPQRQHKIMYYDPQKLSKWKHTVHCPNIATISCYHIIPGFGLDQGATETQVFTRELVGGVRLGDEQLVDIMAYLEIIHEQGIKMEKFQAEVGYRANKYTEEDSSSEDEEKDFQLKRKKALEMEIEEERERHQKSKEEEKQPGHDEL